MTLKILEVGVQKLEVITDSEGKGDWIVDSLKAQGHIGGIKVELDVVIPDFPKSRDMSSKEVFPT